jgi:hypothetical protein
MKMAVKGSDSWLPGSLATGSFRDEDQTHSAFRVDSDLSWFSGHFPGHPILPGVALLFFVQEIINQGRPEGGQRLRIRHLKRIRFRRLVEPGARLTVHVRPRPSVGPDDFGFSVETAGEKVCDGYFTTGPIRD